MNEVVDGWKRQHVGSNQIGTEEQSCPWVYFHWPTQPIPNRSPIQGTTTGLRLKISLCTSCHHHHPNAHRNNANTLSITSITVKTNLPVDIRHKVTYTLYTTCIMYFSHICQFRPMTQPNQLKTQIFDPFPTKPNPTRGLTQPTDNSAGEWDGIDQQVRRRCFVIHLPCASEALLQVAVDCTIVSQLLQRPAGAMVLHFFQPLRGNSIADWRLLCPFRT